MKAPPIASLLDFVVDLATQAGRITLRHFGSELHIDRKADQSPVGETISAARGEGCRRNGSPARVSEVADLAAALIVSTDLDGLRRHDGGHLIATNAALATNLRSLLREGS